MIGIVAEKKQLCSERWVAACTKCAPPVMLVINLTPMKTIVIKLNHPISMLMKLKTILIRYVIRIINHSF
jgi:hypothetical protein